MKQDFIKKWRGLDRKGRRNLVRQFIAARQKAAESVAEKNHEKVHNDSTIGKHTPVKRPSIKLKPIFAFSFASSSSPGEPGDSTSDLGKDGDNSSSDDSSNKKDSKKPRLNRQKNSSKKNSEDRRKIQKQRLVDFINGIKLKVRYEEERRRQEAIERQKKLEEDRRQAEVKAEADRLAKIEAARIRRQELLREKAEKAKEREAIEQARRQKAEELRKQIKPKPVRPAPVDVRPEKKKKLISFISTLKQQYQSRITRQKIAKEALKKQKEIAAIAYKQEKQLKAAQVAEFKERQRQIALQRKELLRAEILLAAKKRAEKVAAEKAKKEYEKQLKEFCSKIYSSVSGLGKTAAENLARTVSPILVSVKKAAGIKVPSPESFVVPTGIMPVPEKEKKAVPAKVEKPKKYREPVKIGPLLRKNAFRILFFLLLLVWLGEILFYTLRWQPPREKFEEMFGSEKAGAQKSETTQMAELKVEEFKIPSISIEGKRDPFSGGVLTMELAKKPKPTEIARAYQPEIITISKKPSIVSAGAQKPVRETPTKISPILKPEKPEPTTATISEATVTKILPPAPATKPEISPLIVPQIECPLVYRGSLIMEGIEYIFLEGKQRTYRVTVGDVVEGFRILKKEKGVLTLSKEGVTIEIPAE
ncbi:MAG: hypothetical protein ACP5JO_01805 [Candidatus Ratteibacteria bacterium]